MTDIYLTVLRGPASLTRCVFQRMMHHRFRATRIELAVPRSLLRFEVPFRVPDSHHHIGEHGRSKRIAVVVRLVERDGTDVCDEFLVVTQLGQRFRDVERERPILVGTGPIRRSLAFAVLDTVRLSTDEFADVVHGTDFHPTVAGFDVERAISNVRLISLHGTAFRGYRLNRYGSRRVFARIDHQLECDDDRLRPRLRPSSPPHRDC